MSHGDVLVTVRLDRDVYRAWRAKAEDARTEVGVLLAHAAARSLAPRSPKSTGRRRYTRLTAEQRAQILAEPDTVARELAERYGCSTGTINNIRREGR